jgi:hypothetical protein
MQLGDIDTSTPKPEEKQDSHLDAANFAAFTGLV